MVFNALEFYILFALVLLLAFTLPGRCRNPLLLAASCVFYMWWRPEYLLLILGSVGIDYFVALGIQGALRPGRRRCLLALSLVSNLGLLFFFKYFGFACDSLRALLGWLGSDVRLPAVEVLLPVGISFYTFQALSYTIDVYRGDTPAERNFFTLFLYVMFFPQLVAGPIERSNHLLPQFSRTPDFDYARAVQGFRLILWGLFKKVAVADPLALLIDPIWANPGTQEPWSLLLATYGFAFQIYADFAAYSDIAIGSARVLGYDIMKNFDRPYLATSIPDFWRRWHISLSTWFRDYVYVPLGGNRVTRSRWGVNILATFLLSGLWHGAQWTFVLWGAYHGMLMLASEALKRIPRLRFPAWIRIAVTFHLVLFGWILFRARTLQDARVVVEKIFSGVFAGPPPGLFGWDFLPLGCALAILILVDIVGTERIRLTRPVRWAAYATGALVLLNVGAETVIPFIYFQF